MRAQIGELFKRYDFSFFGTCFAIFFIGMLNLYSATHANPILGRFPIYQMHFFKFIFSMMLGFGISLIHPKNLFRYSYFIYFFNIFLLILVLVLGKKGMGAQRWLGIGPIQIQPSELMKISLVLALSRWFCRHAPDQELGLKDLMWPALLTFLPTLLIIKQPDLGTGLLLLLIFSVMALYRRLKIKTIIIIGILGLVSGLAMYNFGLKEYQKQRILTFLNPTADTRGSGYNAIQSEIAIGSGQLFGKGFKKSSQASLNYLPENHTDFVFSVFNEEHGFFGALVLIALYIVLFFRFLWLSGNVLKFYDSMVAIGLMAIFFWHTLINMSMVMGLLPIVGLPLPFMSYGGSSLLTFSLACGLVTSVSNTRNLF